MLAFALALSILAVAVSAELHSLTYDANGNLLTGDGYFRVYDGFNRLFAVYNGTDDSGQLIEKFNWHPGENRIIYKASYVPGNPDPVEESYYFNKNYMSVFNATGEYDYMFVYQDDVLVAQTVTGPGINETYFISADPLGTSLIVTNDVGTVVETSLFKPYGAIITGGLLTKRDYRGKEQDPLLGDYDNGARRYNPDMASFVTPDPMAYDPAYQQQYLSSVYDPQNLNHYSYARNNPYRYDDPNGLWAVSIGPTITGSFGPVAGGLSGGYAFSYDPEFGIQSGYVGSVEGGFITGSSGASIHGGGAATFSPSARKVSDLGGTAIYAGGSAGGGALSLGGSVSVNPNAPPSASPDVSFTIGGGAGVQYHVGVSKTGTLTLGGIAPTNNPSKPVSSPTASTPNSNPNSPSASAPAKPSTPSIFSKIVSFFKSWSIKK